MNQLKTEFSNDDIRNALDNSEQPELKYGDIAGLLAEVPGHNDEDDWYWIGQLKDGRFFGAIGGCDYTGWDCQSSLTSWVEESIGECMLQMNVYDRGSQHDRKMLNLLKQLDGEQPFGLEVL